MSPSHLGSARAIEPKLVVQKAFLNTATSPHNQVPRESKSSLKTPGSQMLLNGFTTVILSQCDDAMTVHYKRELAQQGGDNNIGAG